MPSWRTCIKITISSFEVSYSASKSGSVGQAFVSASAEILELESESEPTRHDFVELEISGVDLDQMLASYDSPAPLDELKGDAIGISNRNRDRFQIFLGDKEFDRFVKLLTSKLHSRILMYCDHSKTSDAYLVRQLNISTARVDN